MTAAAQATAVIAAAGVGRAPRRGRAQGARGGRRAAAGRLVARRDRGRGIHRGRGRRAAPRSHLDELLELGATARAQVVAGGATRSDSVAAALELVGSELVAIHDAARPLVTPTLIDALVASACRRAPSAAGVIAAAPITDTVKRADGPRGPRGSARQWPRPRTASCCGRPRRRRCSGSTRSARPPWRPPALTPRPTRPCSSSEAGGRVLIHPAPATNLKVTTPDDLRVAELLLASR